MKAVDGPAGKPRLTVWEKRIVGAFIERYPSSAAAAVSSDSPVRQGPSRTDGLGESRRQHKDEVKKHRQQRLRPELIFPGINRASPDEKESFLEAAESLEGRGLLTLVWARHRKGEDLSALVCRDPELLYQLAGKPSPKTIAEKVRDVGRLFKLTARASTEEAALFSFLAENVTALDAAGGIDVIAVTDMAHLTCFLFDKDMSRPSPSQMPDADPAKRENPWQEKVRGITTRALSTALYGDSKRLEALMTLFNPILTRARRQGIAVPDFSFLKRAYPETFIAGKIELDFGEVSVPVGGILLGLPLETILKLRRIRALSGETTVLTIENKETFFALSESLPGYTCFLYAGGHPNRAVRALLSLLAESGFTFSHAGDLDPDGILILQELAKIAGKPVKPLRMDPCTFDRYLGYGRKLEPSTLRRTSLISEKTRSIPGMAELVSRIEETGIGVEQEIIDYR
ncbi:MAG: DUF2220 family protein [Spirochaetaceae bacterium]|nr:DUF2220 family protein [Spirochaetaceae bacterium]